MKLVPLALVVSLALFACENDDEGWRRFNHPSDTIEISVAPGPVGDPVTFDLRSNTGAVVVGSATIDPGSGPVGTEHLLLVEVLDDWETRVGRATIESDGERGVEEYTLRRDSADIGFYELTLTSLGAEGETRSDVWTLALWEPTDNPEVTQ